MAQGSAQPDGGPVHGKPLGWVRKSPGDLLQYPAGIGARGRPGLRAVDTSTSPPAQVSALDRTRDVLHRSFGGGADGIGPPRWLLPGRPPAAPRVGAAEHRWFARGRSLSDLPDHRGQPTGPVRPCAGARPGGGVPAADLEHGGYIHDPSAPDRPARDHDAHTRG